MNNLYRIKPLEWTDDVTYSDGRTAVESGHYYIEPISENQWFWCYERGYEADYGGGSSLEEAKAACEAHRRKLLEAELEPVHQPTTELPTEPGYYWWRNPTYPVWLVVMVSKAHIFLGGKHFSREEWDEVYDPGQWVRIPEPEEGR